MTTRFSQFVLRTSDVAGAREFYAAVLGPGELPVFELHEQAVARGARPHWLGFLELADVDAAAKAFAERGATPLGPRWATPGGLEGMTLREPGGAVIGLGRPPMTARADEPADSRPSFPEVVWHLLHAKDVERVMAIYAELFGWSFEAPLDLGTLGVFHPFAWAQGGAPVALDDRRRCATRRPSTLAVPFSRRRDRTGDRGGKRRRRHRRRRCDASEGRADRNLRRPTRCGVRGKGGHGVGDLVFLELQRRSTERDSQSRPACGLSGKPVDATRAATP